MTPHLLSCPALFFFILFFTTKHAYCLSHSATLFPAGFPWPGTTRHTVGTQSMLSRDLRDMSASGGLEGRGSCGERPCGSSVSVCVSRSLGWAPVLCPLHPKSPQGPPPLTLPPSLCFSHTDLCLLSVPQSSLRAFALAAPSARADACASSLQEAFSDYSK